MMKRKTITLAGGLGLTLLGFGQPAILDRSVYGHWKFDSGSMAASADISGWGGSAFTVKSGTVNYESSGSYDGSGYLDVGSGTATATLGGGNTLNDTSYQTVFVRYKSNCSISLSYFEKMLMGENDREYIDQLNDHNSWHLALLRYQGDKAAAGTWGSTTWRSAIDPTNRDWWDASPRADVGNDSKILIPAAVSGSTVTVGGDIGVDSKTTGYKGGLDEIVVLSRLMSLDELSRYYQTGETYVYSSDTPSFTAATGWSSNENNWQPKPGDISGAAYIVDGGKTLTQNATATFGGNVGKKISLTLGRTAPLVNMLTGETIVSNTQGNFSQGAGTAITFYDLRLNDGTITAGGTSLTATLLDVDAPASKPFALVNAGDFALNVGEATTGSGVLAKTGAGKLTVNAWTGTAKLRLAAGSIKTPRLDGYAGGTVLVDTTAGTVAFTGTDAAALPTEQNKMQIAFDGTVPTAKTAVMTVPSGVMAAMIEDATAYDGGKVGVVSVEGGTVYVTPVYAEDLGRKVILMGR